MMIIRSLAGGARRVAASLSSCRPGHCVLLLALAASAAVPAAAATVRGTVTDPSGDRVPNARVVLAAPLGVIATTESDARGVFTFADVRAGRYELRVAAAGFRADPVNIDVAADQHLDVPVALHLSAVSESVVVSAAHVELPLTRAADSVTVVTSRDLAALQSETVADAVRAVPGLSVARNGGRGAVTSLFPRGGDSDFTLVLVDGVKANAFGGGYDFSALSTADVERVEVVRGPQSALHGADAIGAVVHVITRAGGAPRADGMVEAGSHGTIRASLGTSGSASGWIWGGSLERVASDGLNGEATSAGETISNDGFRTTHGSASAARRLLDRADLRGTAAFTSSDRGYPGPFGSNPIGAYPGIDTVSRGVMDTAQAGIRWLQPLGNRARQTVSLTWLDLQSDYDSSYGLSASTSSRFGIRWQGDVDLRAGASLSVGAELQRERATSTFIVADDQGAVPIRRRIVGSFAELRLQPTGSLSVTAGLRAEHIRRDRLGSSLDPYSPRPAFDVDTRTSVNPRVSAAYFLSGGAGTGGWTRFHAAAGTGMRAPDALEIAFTDNASLKPERSLSVEAGLDRALFHERLVIGATAFFNRYEDLIIAVGPALQDASRYRTDNISNARARGLELSSAYRARFGLDARLAYTLLSTEILAVDRFGVAPAPFAIGDELLRRPRHQASLDLTWARDRLSAFTRVGARGRTLDVEPSWGSYGGLFHNAGHVVVDLGAAWRLSKALEIRGRVGNLLDRRYEEAYGFPALGRNVMVGVRIAAGR